MCHIMGKDWILNTRIFISKKNITEKVDKHMNRWFTREESQIMNKYPVIILTCKSEQVCFYWGVVFRVGKDWEES